MTTRTDINNDYKYCKKIIEEHSKSFSLVFSKLPERKRHAIYAVYAFCRVLDDSIDIHKDNTLLNNYEKSFIKMLSGSTVNEPIFLALKDSFNHFELSSKPFFELIKGIRSDQDFKQPQTDKELFNYCYQVAGTVGEIILPILAEKNHKKLTKDAIALGCAMQITNILRDVGEDLRNERIYFSKETIQNFEVNISDYKFVPQKKYQDLWEYYASRAEGLYMEGLTNLQLFDLDSQMIVKSAANVYAAILPAVRNIDYSLDKKATVSRLKKMKIFSNNMK